MIEQFLFVALPYLAIFVCVVGSIIRVRKLPMTYSALSSQFLESKNLAWGSLPWHIGIITIVLAHILCFAFPSAWNMLISQKHVLYGIEIAGLAFSFACLFGLLVLAYRRITSDRIQAVTSPVDLLVLLLLTIQVILGIATASLHRWGAAWATGTMVPYLWSLIYLQPNTSYIADLPLLARAHMTLAWLLIFLIPFSRLIHIFAVPLHYLTRPPQNVIWNNPRREEAIAPQIHNEEARRSFIKGSVGIAAGTTLLAAGAIDKVFAFFFGPRLSAEQEGEIMETKLKRLEATTEQRKLELERQTNKFILVGELSELSPTEGKYFIDYEMTPAMAFLGDDGLPVLMSAKCTHLGCTVGNQVKDGKVLCPCHVSYFDIKSGQPNEGAPAKAPLPFLSWALKNKEGKTVASRNRKGEIKGDIRADSLKSCSVYIPKNDEVQV